MKRNRTIVIVTLFAASVLWAALATSVAGAQDANPSFWLSYDTATAHAGQEFTVTVNVASAVNVYGGSFQLLYDTQAFEVVLVDSKAISPGPFFENGPSFALKNSVDADAGTVDYALTLTQPAQPVSGDGVLGTITFRALKDTPITITPVSAELVSPVFTQVDGRLIAQKINQVDAAITDTVIAGVSVSEIENSIVEDSSPDAAAASVSMSIAGQQPVVDSPAISSASVGSIQAPVLTEEHRSVPSNKMLLVAALFFVGGLLLLTVSVGMYSKMRVGFSLSSDRHMERM